MSPQGVELLEHQGISTAAAAAAGKKEKDKWKDSKKQQPTSWDAGVGVGVDVVRSTREILLQYIRLSTLYCPCSTFFEY